MEEWEKDYCFQFDELRKNRVQLSHYKYGRASKNFKTGNVNALKTHDLCIKKYQETGNTEYLLDAANYLMFEFKYPQHNNAHFRATDSNESAGVIGITEKEMEEYKNNAD